MNMSENTLYTQNDVDKIVEKRISRERKNLENYRELKDFINHLKDNGKISASSIGGQIDEIKSLLNNENTIEEAQNQEEILEEMPENQEIDGENEIVITNATDEIDNTVNEAKESVEEEFNAEKIKEICSHPLFFTFAKSKKDDIQTLCRDFTELLSISQKEKNTAKSEANALKATPHIKAATLDSCPLNANQKALAKRAGMSYKKYFELISEIPNSKTKK